MVNETLERELMSNPTSKSEINTDESVSFSVTLIGDVVSIVSIVSMVSSVEDVFSDELSESLQPVNSSNNTAAGYIFISNNQLISL